MNTVNGKLINQEFNQLDELTKNTEKVIRRCDYLESQFTTISKQDYTEYLQKVNQDINHFKSYLQNLDQRIGYLEKVTSKQAKQFLFLKVSSVISLVGLWLMFSMNNQPEPHKNKPDKHVKSTELHLHSVQQNHPRTKKNLLVPTHNI